MVAYKMSDLMLNLAYLYLAVSVVTLFMYGIDKSAAKNNQARVSENVLQLLALIGGWPGALIAQWLFRHKTKKTSFQIVFRMMVLLNIGLLALYWREL